MLNGEKQVNNKKIAHYHLPGLFEFYEFYKVFLPIFSEHREWFYDWCDIGSIYGAPADCIWGGGRAGFGDCEAVDVLNLMRQYDISSRLTFSNSLIREEHLKDKRCNELCKMFETNGIIIYSDMLLDYIKAMYKNMYFVSSTTKVIMNFEDLLDEINREEFSYVVPDFRLNKQFDKFRNLSQKQKDKVEFLCNECCDFGCKSRKQCYEVVSYKNIGEEVKEFGCASKNASNGYRFSNAMKNPGFISVDDILNIYMPMGYTNFKIEGRGLGSALILEFILYYMTKPEYQINVREEIYLDNTLDLF